MLYFCEIVTKAHVIPRVLGEALAFMTAYNSFKQKLGEAYVGYGRVLGFQAIDNLNARQRDFPHFYLCTIVRAKGGVTPDLGKY